MYGQDKDQLLRMIKGLIEYKNVTVHYGLYKNPVVQEAKRLNLGTNMVGAGNHQSDDVVASVDFIYEPDITQILQFFESEIFGSLFEEALTESQVAKFAARMVAMDKASQHIKDELRKNKNITTKTSTKNKKQLNALSAVMGRRLVK